MKVRMMQAKREKGKASFIYTREDGNRYGAVEFFKFPDESGWSYEVYTAPFTVSRGPFRTLGKAKQDFVEYIRRDDNA